MSRKSRSNETLERTERYLERELRRESTRPLPSNKWQSYRQKGQKLVHNKYVLLLVVILNIVDCALVLGELIIDVHYVKEIQADTYSETQSFINRMSQRYPHVFKGYTVDTVDRLYEKIYRINCTVYINPELTTDIRYDDQPPMNTTTDSSKSPSGTTTKAKPGSTHSPVEVSANNSVPGISTKYKPTDRGQLTDSQLKLLDDIAHGLHKASIVILGILLVENIIKIGCLGKEFFHHKLEVFDAFVVVTSFVMDLVLVKGLSKFVLQDALYVISFLLPWRVIRVVNSLIIAVLDQEHFRMKLLYKGKKHIESQLHDLRNLQQKWDFHLQKIESFCESEGIPKWKIRQHTAMGRKMSTITSMASLALNGVLNWICVGPEDKNKFLKSFERSISTNIDTVLHETTSTDGDAVSNDLENPPQAPAQSHTQPVVSEDDGKSQFENEGQDGEHCEYKGGRENDVVFYSGDDDLY